MCEKLSAKLIYLFKYTLLIVQAQCHETSANLPIMSSIQEEVREETLENKESNEMGFQEKIINEYSEHNFDCYVSIKNISLRPFLNWVVKREEHLAAGLIFMFYFLFKSAASL